MRTAPHGLGRDRPRPGGDPPSARVPAASGAGAVGQAALAAAAALGVPRELRRDPPPAPDSGLTRVRFLRPGADFGDGFVALAGDVVAVPERQALALLRNGAAGDFTEEP